MVDGSICWEPFDPDSAVGVRFLIGRDISQSVLEDPEIRNGLARKEICSVEIRIGLVLLAVEDAASFDRPTNPSIPRNWLWRFSNRNGSMLVAALAHTSSGHWFLCSTEHTSAKPSKQCCCESPINKSLLAQAPKLGSSGVPTDDREEHLETTEPHSQYGRRAYQWIQAVGWGLVCLRSRYQEDSSRQPQPWWWTSALSGAEQALPQFSITGSHEYSPEKRIQYSGETKYKVKERWGGTEREKAGQ